MSQIGRSYFTVVAPAHVPAYDPTTNTVDLAPDFVVDADALVNATFIAPAAGSASTGDVTIAGTYVAGDTIILTITSNATSTQLWRKSYKYTVVTGDNVTSIATAIKNLINLDGASVDCPYTATNVAGVITITAKNNDKRSLVFYVDNVSTSGTITAGAITTTISEGQPADLTDKGVPDDKITLASYDTVRITYAPSSALPSIDSQNHIGKEIYWYGTPGNGNALAVLINSL